MSWSGLNVSPPPLSLSPSLGPLFRWPVAQRPDQETSGDHGKLNNPCWCAHCVRCVPARWYSRGLWTAVGWSSLTVRPVSRETPTRWKPVTVSGAFGYIGVEVQISNVRAEPCDSGKLLRRMLMLRCGIFPACGTGFVNNVVSVGLGQFIVCLCFCA